MGLNSNNLLSNGSGIYMIRAQARPEGINKLHEEDAQMPMGFYSHYNDANCTLTASWGVLYDWLTGERRLWSGFTDSSVL